MSKFISEKEISDECGVCSKREMKIAKSGKEYSYCNKYQNPCFKCLEDCKREADRQESMAIDAMERGISRAETDYEGEWARGF